MPETAPRQSSCITNLTSARFIERQVQVAATDLLAKAKETELEVEFFRVRVYGVQLTYVSSPAGAMLEEHEWGNS
jgi:hypothetical protein